MATPTTPARELRMVLLLGHNDTFKHVAVSFDKDLGSPETTAEIASAFGVAATSIESLAIKSMPDRHSSTLELPAANLPLNLNGHDLNHPFNRKMQNLVFGERWYVAIKFNHAEGRRPSASHAGN